MGFLITVFGCFPEGTPPGTCVHVFVLEFSGVEVFQLSIILILLIIILLFFLCVVCCSWLVVINVFLCVSAMKIFFNIFDAFRCSVLSEVNRFGFCLAPAGRNVCSILNTSQTEFRRNDICLGATRNHAASLRLRFLGLIFFYKHCAALRLS